MDRNRESTTRAGRDWMRRFELRLNDLGSGLNLTESLCGNIDDAAEQPPAQEISTGELSAFTHSASTQGL